MMGASADKQVKPGVAGNQRVRDDGPPETKAVAKKYARLHSHNIFLRGDLLHEAVHQVRRQGVTAQAP
jgi:hypothetical protein